MAQSYNLYDVYAIQFGQVAAGLLARPDFPASTLTLAQFLDIVEPIALGCTRRISETVGDMSTAAPAASVFNTGWTPAAKVFEPPPEEAAPPRYVPPTVVLSPSRARVPQESE